MAPNLKTSMAISAPSAVLVLRDLDDLVDDDALIIARIFSSPSPAIIGSVMGLSVAMALGIAVLGLPGIAGMALAGAAGGGMVASAVARHTGARLQAELGISAADGRALFAVTRHWRTARLSVRRTPETDADRLAYGWLLIRTARAARRSKGR